MAEEFEIKPAARVNTPAFIALAGPSGSGKTRSALELAVGLASDGKILLADTEGNRALHYADLYAFDHVEFRPPYTPERTARLIDLAEVRGYAVLIVDSGSDEWEGEGGLQEIRDSMRSRTRPEEAGSGDEYWARTKARHKHALINRLRRSRVHVIFCLRCEERVKISKVRGETVVEHLGWQPICEKRFLYEMQSSFRFDPDRPGIPVPIKLYDIHSRFFPEAQKINRDAGRQLAEWARGASMNDPLPGRNLNEVFATGELTAKQGTQTLMVWWTDELTKLERQALAGYLADWKEIARAADEGTLDARAPRGEAVVSPSEPSSDPAGVE